MSTIPLQVINPTVSCDGCGACCSHMRSPPFIVFCRNGRFEPIGEDPYEDCKRLLLSPVEARQTMADGLYSDRPDDSPCSWLDPDSKRCRWYEHRPDICRNYPVGGDSCQDARTGRVWIVSPKHVVEKQR